MGFFTKLFFGDVKKREQEQRAAQAAEELAEKKALLEKYAEKFPYLASLESVFSYSSQAHECECCKQKVKLFSEMGISSEHDCETLCPECIASGRAAEKLRGTFNEIDEASVSPEDAEVITCKTPVPPANQEFLWKVCCGKPCAYLKRATYEDAEELNLFEELKEDLLREDIPLEDLGELFGNDEDDSLLMLFRCKECGKIHAIVDLD